MNLAEGIIRKKIWDKRLNFALFLFARYYIDHYQTRPGG